MLAGERKEHLSLPKNSCSSVCGSYKSDAGRVICSLLVFFDLECDRLFSGRVIVERVSLAWICAGAARSSSTRRARSC